ncbi:hypothetical protein BJY24_007697 [Nocardia transvalensis]|uniref:4Fe-4S Wbl-type domain-containing protein n=1 Tax=Nocardia transvalensis TaxID=37333 RepID=A0A7W9PMA0_9NOCA|nr:hypothetical protein [Nocardia transvalensis]MBB5918785.1 hypothetical protein [Nocardia transvalensis]
MSTTQPRQLLTNSFAPVQIPAASTASTARPLPKSSHRPPCADGPDDWDLDVGTPESWQSAVRTCHSCPLFDNCSQLAQSLITRGDGPRAMIWAGVAYDSAGRVVENLERHRATPIDHKRPLRIIRTGPRPVCVEPSPPTPHRHIVLGRRRVVGAVGGH